MAKYICAFISVEISNKEGLICIYAQYKIPPLWRPVLSQYERKIETQ